MNPCEAAEHRGLADTVATEDDDTIAATDEEVHLPEHDLVAVGNGQIRNLHRHRTSSGGNGKAEGHRGVALSHLGAVGLNPLHPTVEGLGHLGSLLGLATHGVGQSTEPLDLALFHLRGALALGEIRLSGF